MLDITYCECKDCTNKKCERHRSHLSKALKLVGRASVSDYSPKCKEYKPKEYKEV